MVLPKETSPDAWKDGLTSAETLLKAAEEQAAADARSIWELSRR